MLYLNKILLIHFFYWAFQYTNHTNSLANVSKHSFHKTCIIVRCENFEKKIFHVKLYLNTVVRKIIIIFIRNIKIWWKMLNYIIVHAVIKMYPGTISKHLGKSFFFPFERIFRLFTLNVNRCLWWENKIPTFYIIFICYIDVLYSYIAK